MTDPSVDRLVNAILVPGLCKAAVPGWLAREIGAGLRSVCWFGGRALAQLAHDFPGVMVMADEEGGTVTRIDMATGSPWPGNAALGALDDVSATERIAAGIAATARRAGIGIALAPVVDVNSEPENPVIGVRSFGDDPALVARHGAAFVRGVQSQGVAACAKHFPGHGATRTDSHLSLPVVDADRETFLRRDVAPFAAAVDAGVRCILTAHVSVPAVDATPATMSSAWMALLRDELRFDGVIISDALDMHAIAKGVGRGVGAVNALNAGVDLICIGNPCFPDPYDGEVVFAGVRRDILAAVEDGTLDVARLEQAAERVAALAAWLAAAQTSVEPLADSALLVATALGRDVATRTVNAVGDVRLATAPCVMVEQRPNIATGRLLSPVVAALTARAPDTVSVTARSPADESVAAAIASDRPLVVVSDGLAGDALVAHVRAARPDAVVVAVGPEPIARALFPAPAVFALGNGAANADAVADLLMKE